MTTIESEMLALVKLLRGWIRAGARVDDIIARLEAPGSAGRQILERATLRREAGAAYLGRDQNAIVVEEEPELSDKEIGLLVESMSAKGRDD